MHMSALTDDELQNWLYLDPRNLEVMREACDRFASNRVVLCDYDELEVAQEELKGAEAEIEKLQDQLDATDDDAGLHDTIQMLESNLEEARNEIIQLKADVKEAGNNRVRVLERNLAQAHARINVLEQTVELL